jgi:hypothetical protein
LPYPIRQSANAPTTGPQQWDLSWRIHPLPCLLSACSALSAVRFSLAATYAKGALRNPTSRLFYEQVAAAKQLPVFATAAGDFLKAPEVGLVDLNAFKGLVGDKVTILAKDDVEVVSVHVAIRDSAGAYLEQGPATNVDGPWVYTATTLMPLGQQVTVEAVAKDRPGNVGEGFASYTRTS